jgi:hypothetical protein
MIYRFAFTMFILSVLGILALGNVAIIVDTPQFFWIVKPHVLTGTILCAVSLSVFIALHIYRGSTSEVISPGTYRLDPLNQYMFAVLPVFAAIFGYGALALHAISEISGVSFRYEAAAPALDTIAIGLLFSFIIIANICIGYASYYVADRRSRNARSKNPPVQKRPTPGRIT